MAPTRESDSTDAADNAETLIDPLAAAAYKTGTTPLGWALFLAQTAIEAHDSVIVGRERDPSAFPTYCLPLTAEALACSIIGTLLDAGWTPPGGTDG